MTVFANGKGGVIVLLEYRNHVCGTLVAFDGSAESRAARARRLDSNWVPDRVENRWVLEPKTREV